MSSTTLQRFDDRAPSVGSLSSYLQWVNKVPMLSEEEEKDLVNKLYKYKTDKKKGQPGRRT